MEKKIFVVKRSGEKEEYNPDKIQDVVNWACQGYSNVNSTDIILSAKIRIYDGISTQQIHKLVIQGASSLISEEVPEYQYVASKLAIFDLRKNVWGGPKPPTLLSVLKNGVKKGYYNKDLLKKFSSKEISELDSKISHDRDFALAFAGIQQFCEKYLRGDKSTGELFETPQFAYMLMSMSAFINDPKSQRIKNVVGFYNLISGLKINLPTPVLINLRTTKTQYASCLLNEVDDNLNSIFASNTAVGLYTAGSSGIGLNLGRMRPLGSPIRGGDTVHTGVVPFLKMFEGTVKATKQGSVRGGAATVNFPWWHYEIEDIVVLKNNQGTDDNRVRKLDYCVGLDGVFYERVLAGKDITLFSPHEAKGLYDAWGDNVKFKELYEKYEADDSLIFKKKISAKNLLSLICKEKLETGRIYILHVDHVNSHGAWEGNNVKMTNLCVAPSTKILTKEGNIEIQTLEDKYTEVWNGREYSKSLIKKTALNQELFFIKLEDGRSITCTPYHKFYISNDDTIPVAANQLQIGYSINGHLDPSGVWIPNSIIKEIVQLDEKSDVYCCNEPILHKAVFNGILTGNCVEINHPTIPIQSVDDKNGEIGMCILSAINFGAIEKDELPKIAKLVVRFLDNIIDSQSYLLPASENFTKKKRSLGIGITNYFGWLAKNKLKFGSSEAIQLTNEWVEKMQYELILASCELAEERGRCEHFHQTKYAKGIFPIDTYKKEVDSIFPYELKCDWTSLKEKVAKHGMRHSTLTAQMPCEASSLVQNATNGIEPPRAVVSVKKSPTGTSKQVIPFVNKKDYYTFAFSGKPGEDNIDIIKTSATIQKYFDMSMSTNFYYNYKDYPNGVPLSLLAKEQILAYKYGLKSIYYTNTNDGDKQRELSEEKCAGGACTL